MSVMNIKKQLTMLIKLHKSLYEIANKKTDIIIKGEAEKLQSIVKDESKHIQAIGQTNNLLIDQTHIFLQAQGSEGNPSISAVLEYVSDSDHGEILGLTEELKEQIADLKTKNDENQALLEQSMDFIHLSLDILMPDIEAFNYSGPEQSSPVKQESRSIFDSKA